MTEYIRSPMRSGASWMAFVWPTSCATAASVTLRWSSRALRSPLGEASHTADRVRSFCSASVASVPMAPVALLSPVWSRSRRPSENI